MPDGHMKKYGKRLADWMFSFLVLRPRFRPAFGRDPEEAACS